jgi:hypothetical protein
MKKVSKTFFVSLLLAGCVVLTAAEDTWSKKVSAKTNITYLDLVRKVFPDARFKTKDSELLVASDKIPLKNPLKIIYDGKFFRQMRGQMSLKLDEKLETMSGGEKVLWLLIGVVTERDKSEMINVYSPDTDEYSILAAYRIGENTAQLIDAADVKNNSTTSFTESYLFDSRHSKLAITPRREAVLIYNYNNAALGTDSFALIDFDKNGFRVILNEFHLKRDDRCDSFFDDRAKIKLLQETMNGYRKIEVLVSIEKGYGDITIWRRRFRYMFAWNPRTSSYQAIVNPEKRRDTTRRKRGGCGS